MSVAYIPPGVTVQELLSTSLSPLLAIPGSVSLVGLAQGYIQQTDQIQLTGTTAVTLPRAPSNATMATGAIVSVIDALQPSLAPNGYSSTTDYTFSNTNHTIARQVTANTLSTGASAGASTVTLTAGAVPVAGQVVRLTNTGGSPVTELLTVLSVSGQIVTFTSTLVNAYLSGAAAAWGNIPDSNFVYVTYQYTPSDYFQPIRLTNMADIQERFGNAWDSTQTVINSPLSFAASLLFQNGASNVVLQALFGLSGAQATTADNANPAVWTNVYNQNLLALQDTNIIVPVVGQSQTSVTDSIVNQIQSATQDLLYQYKTSQQVFAIAITGEDFSTATSSVTVQDSTMLAHSNTLKSRYNNGVTQQIVYLNSGSLSMDTPAGTTLSVGGQYAAAAIAGMLAAQTPVSTLTRQALSGFSNINDTKSLSMMNNDAANSLCVLQGQGNAVIVRHSITLDSTNVATRELNVVRGKHYLIETLTQTINTQVIGKLVADANAPVTLNNLIIATLEDLKGLNYIGDYANVASRVTAVDPTTMAVTFDYLPIFTVNYVNIQFTVDLTTGQLTVSANGSTS